MRPVMKTDSAYTFVIADPHPLTCYGLARLIDSQSQFRVLAEVPAGADAVAAVHRHHPHCLLLSFDLPDTTGVQVLRELSTLPVSMRRILLADAVEPAVVVQALHLGAHGILNTNWNTAIMLKAIEKVLFAGEYCLEREYIGDLLHAMRGPQRFLLTPRERQVITLIVDGCSNKQIGAVMGVSIQTVKHHLSSIYDKLGVSSRLELAAFAIHHRLNTAPDLKSCAVTLPKAA